MPRKPFVSISVALQTLRANPLHTLLSTLGIVIGVAALVAILSLGDGMEAFARKQIERTTDLQTILVSSQTMERIDGVWVRRIAYPKLTVADAERLAEQLADQATVTLFTRRAAQIRLPDDTVRSGAYVRAVMPNALKMTTDKVRIGRFIDSTDVQQQQAVVVLAEPLARRLFGEEPGAALMGKPVLIDDKPVELVGILTAAEEEEQSVVYVPLGASVGGGPQSTPPALAVQFLMSLQEWLLREEKRDRFNEIGVRMRFVGDLDDPRIPDNCRDWLRDCEKLTQDNETLQFAIAFNYGGQAEMLRAVRSFVESGADVTELDEAAFRRHLYCPDMPDIDLLVRTSAEQRVSNYFPWHTAYSEFVFTDVLWPDFRAGHMYSAVSEFQSRNRRKGGMAATPS